MRIVIDMQGAQSTGSWNRGIGRYTMSIASEIARSRGEHEVFLVVNGVFPESVDRIRATFSEILPQSNIVIWNAPIPMARADSANDTRRQWGELIREGFLLSLHPDVVLVSSLFEGFGDNVASSIKLLKSKAIVSVILYDLIPFIQQDRYLENSLLKSWYLDKIDQLRCADLWFAISDSSRKEGIEHLGLPPEQCINVSADADKCFTKTTVSSENVQNLRRRYNLLRKFVMYTGGIDHRKNIEGLIRAYAMLNPDLRACYQLAIVCTVQDESRRLLMKLAKSHGLQADDVVLTGFVPEQDLIYLYSLCTLFVFPSKHEGFGLPVLEAMRCGAPVIAANTSSLPEVVGLSDALFDPYSDTEIAIMIDRVLSDTSFRQKLITHGARQAAKFSWRESTRRALRAMEIMYAERNVGLASVHSASRRPLLAFLSPLPSEHSGIADYSAELLQVLSKFYEIEVVVSQAIVADPWIAENCPIRNVEWFLANSHRFDRVLYHFGNSTFHQHMFGLLKAVPGVVVLHDFYLSGILHHMDARGYAPGIFSRTLFHSHGYRSLVDMSKSSDISDVVWRYPCSGEVMENALGTIVHSDHSLMLASEWYGCNHNDLSIIPHLRVPVSEFDKSEARAALGILPSDFVVCSFGIIGPTKLSHRLLRAWFGSDLADAVDCRLIFVGECLPGDYHSQLLSSIRRHPSGSRVSITGRLEHEVYRQYLAATDMAIQLRTRSRGETSGAVLDCMNYGHPTIVNANGSMANLPDETVYKLLDAFSDQELVDALEELWRNGARRHQLGANALTRIRSVHDPLTCAERYKDAIEYFYSNSRFMPNCLMPLVVANSSEVSSNSDLVSLAQSIANTFPPPHVQKQLLIDVSGLVSNYELSEKYRYIGEFLQLLILNCPSGWRVEPVYALSNQPYRYARKFTTAFLEIPCDGLEDDPLDLVQGDIFIALDIDPGFQAINAMFYQSLRRLGLNVKFLVHDHLLAQHLMQDPPLSRDGFTDWVEAVLKEYGVICTSKLLADELSAWMMARTADEPHTLLLEWLETEPAESLQDHVLGSAPCAHQLLSLLLGAEKSLVY